MVGRFASVVRNQRGISPRRARAMLVMGCVLFLGSVTMLLLVKTPEVPAGMGAAGSAIMMHADRAATHNTLEQSNLHTTDGTITGTRMLAQIVTCPACRLNSLPKVKKFVHGDAKRFPALNVKFLFGQDPRLHLYDKNGKEVENIDLAPMNGTQIMRRLYQHGLRPSTVTPTIALALGSNVQLADTK